MEKYRVIGESVLGPIQFAIRRVETQTSGRRRANPRTYPSTSTASLLSPV